MMKEFHELYDKIVPLSPSVAEQLLELASHDWPSLEDLAKKSLAVWVFRHLTELESFHELPEFVQARIKSELINEFANGPWRGRLRRS